MICPACGNDTRVSNSRPNSNNTIIRRRRICTNCDNRFSTVERLTLKCKVVNAGGNRENFDEARLHRSVLLSLYDLPQPEQQAIADRVVDGITTELSGKAVQEITSAEIREKVREILLAVDEWLAQRYLYAAPSPDRSKTIESLQGELGFDDADEDD